MISLAQSLRTGALRAVEAPAPRPLDTQLLIKSRASLISSGTERMLVDFGRAGWLAKSQQQPDKARLVLDKIRTDGLASTFEAIRAKLDQPIPLGYSNAGVVLEAGPRVKGFRPGDRVVSNGPHAEIVRVPANLCARIPDNVPDEHAAFSVVGAIALEGIRLAQPALGEIFVVTGLGLIGLMAVQLLRAHGCHVLGIDLDPGRAELARQFGAAEAIVIARGEDPIAAAQRLTTGRGVDGVLITAATKSNDPIHHAATMCRKRGRIVLVGVAGLELSRDDFYKKELSFQVSCSYGPGRYDPSYEQGGHDYPYPYVRWTAQRNFEAVLGMIADGRLQVEPLITHHFSFDRALEAYELLDSDRFNLGILLKYSREKAGEEFPDRRTALRAAAQIGLPSKASIGFIGAGGYATKTLIPAFQRTGACLVSIASNDGLSAAHVGRRFGFEEATTDVYALFANTAMDTVVIATRHDSHAELVCRALKAGRHVFVEKPLALDLEQMQEIQKTWQALPKPRLLMVGFNRRFAPQTIRMRELLQTAKGPKAFVYTVNAGAMPADHWIQDPVLGGGRILGEACHFIDLLRFLAGCPAKDVQAVRQSSDTITITVAYEDGSIGAIHYIATGHKAFPKERLEVFVGGRILVLDNFRKLRGYGWPGFKRMNLWRQNKGASEMAAAFVNAVRAGAPSPIPFVELMEVSRIALKAASA